VKAFKFRLERVRKWQSRLCAIQEQRLGAALEQVAASRQTLASARAEAAATEEQLRACKLITAADLRGWAAYRRGVAERDRALEQDLQAREADADRERLALVATRRRLRCVEMLRERAYTDHHATLNQELEQLAQESYLHSRHRANNAQ
jgi:hypothetical protein